MKEPDSLLLSGVESNTDHLIKKSPGFAGDF